MTARWIFIFFLIIILPVADAAKPVFKKVNKQFSRHIHRQVHRLMKQYRISQSQFAFVVKDLFTGHLDYELQVPL